MNEPANFRDGPDAEAVCDMTNKLNSPPYIPGTHHSYPFRSCPLIPIANTTYSQRISSEVHWWTRQFVWTRFSTGESSMMYTVCMAIAWLPLLTGKYTQCTITWNSFLPLTSSLRALQQVFPNQRPLVLTRSTFVSTNRYAIHWLGDNQSQWRQLPWSIVSMLEFSIFGFSMVGTLKKLSDLSACC